MTLAERWEITDIEGSGTGAEVGFLVTFTNPELPDAESVASGTTRLDISTAADTNEIVDLLKVRLGIRLDAMRDAATLGLVEAHKANHEEARIDIDLDAHERMARDLAAGPSSTKAKADVGVTLEARVLKPSEAVLYLDELVALRAAFYAEWPYLQATDRAAHRAFLEMVLSNPDSIVIAMFDGGAIAACNLSQPLASHIQRFPLPFQAWLARQNVAAEDMVYSIYTLSWPRYRGAGLNREMSRLLDAEVKTRGFAGRVIHNIIRHAGDARAPKGWRPSTGYFFRMGYQMAGRSLSRTSWTDIGADAPSEKVFEHLVKWTE